MTRLEKYVSSFKDDKCTQVSDTFCYQLWASLEYVFEHDQEMFKEAFRYGMKDKKELIEWRNELNKKLCEK
jgi:hypothetical protein